MKKSSDDAQVRCRVQDKTCVRTGSARRIALVADILRDRYGDFQHFNRRNPLEELLFIVCSVRTDEAKYRKTYAALRREFPTFELLKEAQEPYICESLLEGGLARQKARTIRGIIRAVIGKFGRLTLAPLRSLSDHDCEEFLVSLPGVGRKVARCVMMYSLGREVFPVDTHCWRIGRRLGWVRATRKDQSCSGSDMDRFQRKVPPGLRFSLHVNLISLGRQICTPHNPKCKECPIQQYCPRIGVPKADLAGLRK